MLHTAMRKHCQGVQFPNNHNWNMFENCSVIARKSSLAVNVFIFSNIILEKEIIN